MIRLNAMVIEKKQNKLSRKNCPTIPGLGLILWAYISASREQSETSGLFSRVSNSRRAS